MFQCIWKYLSIFEHNYYIFECIDDIFQMYFIFIYSIFMVYFNVFTDIVIVISLSHFHCNVFVMHAHLQFCFSLSTMTSFPTCFTNTLFFPVSIDPFQFSCNLWKKLCKNSCFPHLFITPHSTFNIVFGCTEYCKAQICLYKNYVLWLQFL
jgi:hypothetical protein